MLWKVEKELEEKEGVSQPISMEETRWYDYRARWGRGGGCASNVIMKRRVVDVVVVVRQSAFYSSMILREQKFEATAGALASSTW